MAERSMRTGRLRGKSCSIHVWVFGEGIEKRDSRVGKWEIVTSSGEGMHGILLVLGVKFQVGETRDAML